MTLPVVKLAHQKSFNIASGNTGTREGNYVDLLFNIHNALQSFSPSVAVAGSSDGVTAGMDASDRWDNTSKIVWGTSIGATRSWIVYELQNGGQILFDCRSSSASTTGRSAYVYWAPFGGYTGGSVTATPTTSGDEQALVTNGYWMHSQASGSNVFRTHVWYAHAESQLMIASAYNGNYEQLISLADVVLDEVGWTAPYTCSWSTASNQANKPTYSNFYDNVNPWAIDQAGGTFGQGIYGCLGGFSDGGGQGSGMPLPNVFSGKLVAMESHFGSKASALYGWHGVVRDMLWGSSTQAPNGSHYAAHTWEQIGDMILPGDGATQLLVT